MTTASSQHRRALAGLLLANLLWGVSFPVIKAMVAIHHQLLPESGNWFITALTVAPRFLLAAGVLLALGRVPLATLTRNEWRQGLLIGGFTGLGMLLQVDGLQFTAASTSAFLTQFYAIMIPVVLACRARRLPPPRVWLCATLVLAGVAILGRFDFHTLSLGRGEVETLLCSVFYMGQIFVIDDPRYAGNRVIPVSTVMFLTCGLLFGGLALGTAPRLADCLVPWGSGPWVTWTLVLTVCCTLGAFVLMNRWQPLITATEAGLIYCFEPVFASALALFLPALLAAASGIVYANETLTWELLAGGGLITLANVLLQLKPPAKAVGAPA